MGRGFPTLWYIPLKLPLFFTLPLISLQMPLIEHVEKTNLENCLLHRLLNEDNLIFIKQDLFNSNVKLIFSNYHNM